MTVKLRAPDGTTSLSFEGVEYPVAADGGISVPSDEIAKAAASHGFRPWNDGAPIVVIEAMTRSQLISYVMKRTLETIERMSTEDIRERVLMVDPKDIQLPGEHEGAGVEVKAEGVTADDIAAMNRPQLFAFLKAHGIAVAPPVRNDELRAIARDALARQPEPAESPETKAPEGSEGSQETDLAGAEVGDSSAVPAAVDPTAAPQA